MKINGNNNNTNDEKSFNNKYLLEEIMELQSRCMSIESENGKVKIQSEITEKIKKIELEINENFEKKRIS